MSMTSLETRYKAIAADTYRKWWQLTWTWDFFRVSITKEERLQVSAWKWENNKRGDCVATRLFKLYIHIVTFLVSLLSRAKLLSTTVVYSVFFTRPFFQRREYKIGTENRHTLITMNALRCTLPVLSIKRGVIRKWWIGIVFGCCSKQINYWNVNELVFEEKKHRESFWGNTRKLRKNFSCKIHDMNIENVEKWRENQGFTWKITLFSIYLSGLNELMMIHEVNLINYKGIFIK